MLAPPHRPKRPRSPSPTLEPDLASPLDVILKRRRRQDLSFSSPGEAGNFESTHGDGEHHDYFDIPASGHGNGQVNQQERNHAESSSSAIRRSMAGIERRRTKQWEKLNAPHSLPSPHSPFHSHSHLDSCSNPTSTSFSQPTPPHTQLSTNNTPNFRNAYSQNDVMSSSPIRNIPPSSSPFKEKEKEKEKHRNGDWNADDSQGEVEEDMDEAEMRKEWGQEYEKQNWLLHSLHVAKLHSQPHPVPTQTQLQPQHLTDHMDFCQIQSTQSTDSGSTLIPDSTLVSPHPAYRNHPSNPDSSPFNSHHPSVQLRSPSYMDGMVEDEDMEVIDDDPGGMDKEIKRRYEETNRLLGELEVVRRRRWG
ncbi:uncharacterized protein IL334_000545 [Kwoniella shivajii]|uniref:Uncharacterized protein n=1 Tax=Kwoniella shivajii TaxID=564305 RepID=A0ABZ1CPF3_9TREE|nr:hypothetical protein IL334_000545 [Kwoniella shivajii]